MAAERLILDNREVNTIEFGVDVKGIETKNIKARYVIEKEGVQLTFETLVVNAEAVFNLPVLKEMIGPGEYNSRLEIIVENERLFTPVNDLEIEIIQPIDVTATRPTAKGKGAKKSPTKRKKAVNESGDDKEGITVSGVRKRRSIADLIEENLDELAGAKNVNNLLFIYSQKVLLREHFIPISIIDVMPELDKVCKTVHEALFSDYIKVLKSE